MSTEKISYIEAISLITIVMINKIILNTPKDIIAKTGPSSCLNVIYISILAILTVCLIAYLFKKFPGKDILDISQILGGKMLKTLIGIAYIILLIILTASIIKSLSETLRIIYFRTSPILYISLFFVISSIICNRFSLKVIAKANLMIAPIIFLSIIIILASSIKNFMPERIFPILGYGIDNTFFSGLSNIFSFSGMLYLLFLPPLFDKPDKLKQMSIVAITISSIYLLLSVACLLLSLSFTMHSDESFSLYVLTRNLEFGRFIQRVDAIFILVWIIAIISYINFPISLSIYIFKKLTNISDTNSFNYSINLLILGLCIIPIEYAVFANLIGKFLQNWFLILFFGISIPILILANLKISFRNLSKNFIKKSCKTLSIISILAITLTQLSGCYDARGIEDLAYVTALGIDISENDMLCLTFQISIPEASSSSGSGSSQSSKSENTTVQCSSIDSGISLANSYISKQINLSHCKVIVFSEEIASKGLNNYIDTLSNNIEIRPNCNVIISRGKAKDFIENSKPSIETLTARYYEIALKSSEYTGYTTSTEFATFVNSVKNSFIEASAILGGINNGKNAVENNSYSGIDGNYVAGETPIKSGSKNEQNNNNESSNTNNSSNEFSNDSQKSSGSSNNTDDESANQMETFGTAVFKDDKLVGELTGFETLCYLLISDKIETCTISVPNPSATNNTDLESSSHIDLNIRKSKNPKIKLDLSTGIPIISLDLFLEAHGLTLNKNIDYTSMSDVTQLEKTAEQYMSSKITEFLYKTSKEYNSDIIGFGKYALSKYLTWEEWQNSDWTGNYKNTIFNVNVNIRVIAGSEFDKSP